MLLFVSCRISLKPFYSNYPYHLAHETDHVHFFYQNHFLKLFNLKKTIAKFYSEKIIIAKNEYRNIKHIELRHTKFESYLHIIPSSKEEYDPNFPIYIIEIDNGDYEKMSTLSQQINNNTNFEVLKVNYGN